MAPDALGGAPVDAPDGRAPTRRRRLPLPRLPRGPLSVWRVVRWVITAIVGWIALSLVLFLISAQIRQGDLSGKVALGGAGFPLTSANTVLVLGSDTRTKGSKEPGADTSGRGRSDSIMLMRVGGGKNATRWSTSRAMAATRSTPRTRSVDRRWPSRPSSSTSASRSTTSSR
jgi:hypothetical protein